ncbi:general substrate transporter [Chlamydoabsidia padenii]|nr:general substrate transporter [Chlamydoabsidia padenii]
MDSLDTHKTTWYLNYCVLTACLSSFANGWVIGSPNLVGEATHNCKNGNQYVANPLFPDCLPMNSAMWGFAVASFCIGGLIGSLSGGQIQSSLGRKLTLLLHNSGFILGGIFIGFSLNVPMFIIGRILCGFSCGLGSLVVPTYIIEISPLHARGAVGCCHQFLLVIGILASSGAGFPLSSVPLWRVNYALVMIPAIVQVCLIPTCVESPRWLMNVNRPLDAKLALERLRYGMSIDREFESIQSADTDDQFQTPTSMQDEMRKISPVSPTAHDLDSQKKTGANKKANLSLVGIFRDPVIRPMALMILYLHVIQQLIGMNAVMYYSNQIFAIAFNDSMSKLMALCTTIVNFLMTIVAVASIDRMGRRPLLLLAESGACFFSILLVIGYIFQIPAMLVFAVFGYVASFAIGVGPIPWLLPTEMIPTYASSAVGAASTSANWTMNFVIGQTFPVIFEWMQGYSFLIFATVALLAFIYTYIKLPETKGRSIESIMCSFKKESSQVMESP